MPHYYSNNTSIPPSETKLLYGQQKLLPEIERPPTLVECLENPASRETLPICEYAKPFTEKVAAMTTTASTTSTTTVIHTAIAKRNDGIKPITHPLLLNSATTDSLTASPPSSPRPITIVTSVASTTPENEPSIPASTFARGLCWISGLFLNNSLVSSFWVATLHLGERNQDASVIMVTVFLSWLLTRIGCGILGCLLIGAFLVTYYKRAMRRMRRDARDDIERELMDTRMLDSVETADWLNHFVQRFWLIYEPILSSQIIAIADAILVESTPAFLDSIRLSTFTLGNRSFQIKKIRTYPQTEPNVVCMDWSISFNPHDLADLTQAQVKACSRPKIVLTIRVGKGMIGAEIPVLLEDIKFSGKMRLTFKLFSEFPYIKTVKASFLEEPQFDYALMPVGGEMFGFDINNIPGLQTFVQEQVHATLRPMMYAPNAYTLDVAEMMTGTTDIYSANGVLAIIVYGASNLEEVDLFGTMDPYITFHVGNVQNPELGRTSAYENTTDPKWNETHFVLLNKLNDTLYLQIMDRNLGRKDTVVGVSQLGLQEIEDDDNSQLENLTLVALRSGKPTGEVKCGIRYFDVSKPTKVDGIIVPAADSNSGVLQLTVHECRGLGDDSINAYAIIKVNGQEKTRTKVFKRSSSPRWNKTVEVFVIDRTTAELEVTIVDSKEFADDEMIGHWKIGFYKMFFFHRDAEWWHVKGCQGKLHLSSVWKPVAMGFETGSVFPTSPTDPSLPIGYSSPIGVVRIHIHGARDLKNIEGLTGGTPDPYVRVLSGMQVRGQTEWRDDDLDPDWDNAVLYIPIHSVRDILTFEVMDFNNITSDESLGVYEFAVKQIVKRCSAASAAAPTTASGSGSGRALYYHKARNNPVDMWVDLQSPDQRILDADTASAAKSGQGRLHFTASFIPAMTLPKDEQGEVVLANTDLHGECVKYSLTEAEEDGSTRKKIDLFSYESGILCVTVHEANLNVQYKAAVDIFVDSNDAQYSTSELKGGHLIFNETGDAFVKELDFSRLTIRARPEQDSDKDDSTLGYYHLPVREIVRNIMEKGPGVEHEYTLVEDEGSTVRLSFDYIPVVGFTLDPNESLENQGNLTVTALSATDVAAVDRCGTSDTFVVFNLGDHKVYTTQVYKKQLNPVFQNEVFTVPVPNRIGIKLMVEMYDWDQIGKDRLLSTCEVSFGSDDLESFAARNMTITMQEEEGGGRREDATKTTLHLRLLWQPQLLARQRTSTSMLLSQTTRIFTTAPGALFDLGKTVIERIGTAGSIELPASPVEQVVIKVTLIEAKGLKDVNLGGTNDPYARISLNNKTVFKSKVIKATIQPEWNETFIIKIINDRTKAAKMRVHVIDWNPISDDDIGDCFISVWELLKPREATYDGWLSLTPEGHGEVHLRLELL